MYSGRRVTRPWPRSSWYCRRRAVAPTRGPRFAFDEVIELSALRVVLDQLSHQLRRDKRHADGDVSVEEVVGLGVDHHAGVNLQRSQHGDGGGKGNRGRLC